MDWSHYSIPAMRLEARFGDRVVPAFCERPNSIWAMVSAAAARNPDGEALVCGARRMTWREVAQQSAAVAAGLRKMGLRTRRSHRAAARQPHRIRAGDVWRGPSRPGDGAARHPAAKAGDRLCARRLRRQAPDPRGRACRPAARCARRSRSGASHRRRRRCAARRNSPPWSIMRPCRRRPMSAKKTRR